MASRGIRAVGGENDAELFQALRQCDGSRVQCLLMVRDDFWLAVSRFMQALEIRLVEGENSRLVDLFDARHARKVLAALGAAFGALPESAAERSPEQDAFLDQAVAGLAQDGKVVSVRLALFAEMVKSRPWTPATLARNRRGGGRGRGISGGDLFFANRAAAPSLAPEDRAGRPGGPAAGSRAPTSGATCARARNCWRPPAAAIARGNSTRSWRSGQRVRLVTPSDSESLEADGRLRRRPPRDEKYQLTHDYLVPSLRTWLTRKQKATRHGRAELRLADLAALWDAKPEGRRLPSLLEFLNICWLTDRKTWTGPQRKMMGKAGRMHGIRWASWRPSCWPPASPAWASAMP